MHCNYILDYFRPQNKEELFNLRHAQAQNVIEGIFGVLKRWFRILLIGPEYHPHIQARIVAALCAIHNFIRIYDAQEGPLPDEHDPEHLNYTSHAGDTTVDQMGGAEHGVELDVVQRRNSVAEAMWNAYQELLRKRGAIIIN